MIFKVKRWLSDIEKEALPDTLYLENLNWDDEGYKTSFRLHYCTNNKKIITFGDVKILNNENKNTYELLPLDYTFKNLDESFFSLGEKVDYYRKLGKQHYSLYEFVLRNLNDIGYISGLKEKIANNSGYHKSLLRFSSSVMALKNAKLIIDGGYTREENTNYIYSTLLDNADSQHKINFSFQSDNYLSNRSFVLIGKNGVGKSKVLENLIYDITKKNKDSFNYLESTFSIPDYSRILLYKYGLYDSYDSISQSDTVIMIQNYYSTDTINEKLLEKIRKIRDKGKDDYILKFFKEIFPSISLNEIENKMLSTTPDISFLSSGQRLTYEFFIELIAEIFDNTLIIIDELENHLHPNLLSQVIRELLKILDDYNSYAVIATHSPLILQQVPSSQVRVIKREGNLPSVHSLDIECFGENLSEITRNIFEVSAVEDNYKTVLENLSKIYNYDEIQEYFSNRLSYSASIYLKTLYYKQKSEDEKNETL